MTKYVIGIDLGGTKILAGLVDKASGRVLYSVKDKTKKIKGNEKILEKIFETLKELFKISNVKKSDISSIGIGLPGQVDRENGVLISGVNLKCKNLEVKKAIEKKFDIKTYIGNDVEVAALGELKFGAGKDYKDIVCIFVGTGIGSSIIKNGKIHFGASGCAGEIGHIVVDFNGRACACGAHGCLEAYASRSAIEGRILGAVKKGLKSAIVDIAPKLNSISSKHIKQALDAHDGLVTRCVGEAVDYLSSGVASVINFYNPELIILGGGLIQSVDEFYLNTVKKARSKALQTPGNVTEFKKAQLGDFSGVVGAAFLESERKNG
jgi:glucokinase